MKACIAVALLLAAASAAGNSISPRGNAHFVGDPVFTINGGSIAVSGKVAGLGDVPQIHVVLSGTAQCVNPGNNKPQAANKVSVNAGGDFPVQNGKALFNLTAFAQFQPDCSPPMTVQWSDLQVTVTADDGTFLVYP